MECNLTDKANLRRKELQMLNIEEQINDIMTNKEADGEAVKFSRLLACPFCGEQATEIKDMGEINAAKGGVKPVNPFGCKNCGIFVSTKEDWNMRDGKLTFRA